MGNYLLSVAGLSAAGSMFMNGDSSEAATWAYFAVALLMCVVAVREFARGVFATNARRSAPGR
jgi:hypothetical protein